MRFLLFIVILPPSSQTLSDDIRALDLSPGNTWAVCALSDIRSGFNIPLCDEYIMFPSGIIEKLPCCTGTVFVAGTLAVMRWSPAPVLAMPLPSGVCVEEGGDTVVYTIS